VSKQSNDGKQSEDIEVDMKLSVMEPRWIISYNIIAYNNLRAEVGMCVVSFEAQICEGLD